METECNVCSGTGCCPFGASPAESSGQYQCSTCGGTGSKDMPEMKECSICSTPFNSEDEGVHGYIGIIEFALCQECLNGMRDMCEENYICPHCEKMAGDEDV